MDDRLFPQSKQFRIPLYPEYRSSNQSHDLNSYILRYFNIEPEAVLYAESATLAFLLYLAHQDKKQQTIAIPNYFCPQFTYQCMKAGHKLILYDWNMDYQFSDTSSNFAVSHNADVIIIPEFFGFRDHKQELIKYFLDLGITIIIDKAQSFPSIIKPTIPIKHNNLLYLLSFGRSKPISGPGGGALIRTNGEFEPISKKVMSWRFLPVTGCCKLSDLTESVLKSAMPGEFKGSILKEDLPEELNDKLHLFFSRTLFMEQAWKRLKENLPAEKLQLIKGIFGYPSIMALYAKHRFNLANRLFERGIQATWYYYPLSTISFFKDCIIEYTEGTQTFIDNILIIPWGIRHTDEQINYIIETITDEI
ncbi:aminotransferase DegT [Candidatus Odyssella thessalonicensis]|uniref:aminotransferase DegT n=1 Tax=Candidatus Odyssella thessalonicensis TaxID=84647 RepID=UPI000225A999|nr:aminotransferase DegT [Candidatus Odyssella thessalonicensis]